MLKRKRRVKETQKHAYRAQEHKSFAWIDWFHSDSSWAQPNFQIPEQYVWCMDTFEEKMQEILNHCDVGAKGGDCLDTLIDNECHIAIRQLNLARIEHQHSLMEIETTKKAHLAQLEAEIAQIKKEICEITEKECV